jgi:hypothetical protein
VHHDISSGVLSKPASIQFLGNHKGFSIETILKRTTSTDFRQLSTSLPLCNAMCIQFLQFPSKMWAYFALPDISLSAMIKPSILHFMLIIVLKMLQNTIKLWFNFFLLSYFVLLVVLQVCWYIYLRYKRFACFHPGNYSRARRQIDIVVISSSAT